VVAAKYSQNRFVSEKKEQYYHFSFSFALLMMAVAEKSAIPSVLIELVGTGKNRLETDQKIKGVL